MLMLWIGREGEVSEGAGGRVDGLIDRWRDLLRAARILPKKLGRRGGTGREGPGTHSACSLWLSLGLERFYTGFGFVATLGRRLVGHSIFVGRNARCRSVERARLTHRLL